MEDCSKQPNKPLHTVVCRIAFFTRFSLEFHDPKTFWLFLLRSVIRLVTNPNNHNRIKEDRIRSAFPFSDHLCYTHS